MINLGMHGDPQNNFKKAIIRGSLKFLRDPHIYDKFGDGGPHFYLTPVRRSTALRSFGQG